jgi:uncharacterized protein (TIGR02611 family)
MSRAGIMTDPQQGSNGRWAPPPRRSDRVLLRVAGLVLRLARGSFGVARRIVIGVVGISVVLVGVIMVVTPGPALVVIPLGLAILALEFAWARRLLRLFRVRARQMYRDQRRGNYRFWRHWWRR